MSAKSKVPQPMSPKPTQLLHLQLNPESIYKSTPQKSQSTNLDPRSSTWSSSPEPEHLSTFMSKTWNPSLPTSRSFFSLSWRHVLSEKGWKVTMSQSRGQELLGNGTSETAVGRLGPTTLRTFLLCHFLSIMIEFGNVERGGAAVFMATGISGCQNTEAFCLWTFNWDMVWTSHKHSLFHCDSVFF